LFGWGMAFVAALCFCAQLGRTWQAALSASEVSGGMRVYGQSFGEFQKVVFTTRPQETPPAAAPEAQPASFRKARPVEKTFQDIRERGGVIRAEYGFTNFSGDELRISYAVSGANLRRYGKDYGYTDAELNAIDRERRKALKNAYARALSEHLTQTRYNQLCKDIEFDFKAKRQYFIVTRGFRLEGANTVAVDIPAVVRRNAAPLNSVAQALENTAAAKNYDSQDTVGAALSLVQTAVLYAVPPDVDAQGRHTGGIWPPLEALALGKGDCDTKSALLGALLSNWPGVKLLGVGVPEHYLLAMRQNPAKGEMFVEYQGEKYVLLEPAGPAWLAPGSVGEHTAQLLEAGDGFRLEPFV